MKKLPAAPQKQADRRDRSFPAVVFLGLMGRTAMIVKFATLGKVKWGRASDN
jgi:hypothetical protein